MARVKIGQGYDVHRLQSNRLLIFAASAMAPYIQNIRFLECGCGQVNIKATTTERLGFIGCEEGIAAQAVCLIEKTGLK